MLGLLFMNKILGIIVMSLLLSINVFAIEFGQGELKLTDNSVKGFIKFV